LFSNELKKYSFWGILINGCKILHHSVNIVNNFFKKTEGGFLGARPLFLLFYLYRYLLLD